MKLLITGADGFLGRRLIKALLCETENSPAIDTIIAADLRASAVDDEHVDVRTGSLADPAYVRGIVDDDVDVVVHLAAVLSGQSEGEFDLGLKINVDATRDLLEACRNLDRLPRFVFSSSLAVFGGKLPEVVPPDMVLTPESSYGTGKAVVELLINEYTRRGFIDGIACRLPTITVRAGTPNSAASSFVSGIIREPLNGEQSVCPVPLDTRLWIGSPDTAVENLVHAIGMDTAPVGLRRSLNLPGLTVTPRQMLDSLERIGGSDARRLVRHEEDDRIKNIVCSWPGAFDVSRAIGLGFRRDADFDAVVRRYVEEVEKAGT